LSVGLPSSASLHGHRDRQGRREGAADRWN
jgi:hypothetical protein